MDQPTPLHSNPKVAEALSFLQAAEQSASAATPTGLAWARQQYDYAIERLRAVGAESAEFRRWLGLALLGRGNTIIQQRQEKSLEEGLASLEEASDVIRTSGFPDDNTRWNDEANIWIARGLALGAADLVKNIDAAVKAIDQSIEMRKKVAEGKHPEVNHAIAVAWLSRADLLMRSGRPDLRGEAIRSFEEAINILRELPYDKHDNLRHQLAMALMNRALALQGFGPDAVTEGIANIEATIQLMEGQPLAERPEGRHLLAAAILNRGGLIAQKEGVSAPIEVRNGARGMLEVLRGHEEQHAPLAEAGLRARILVARTTIDLLGLNGESTETKELVSEATDAVDEGLALVRTWEQRRVHAFRGAASELFRLGVLAYQKYQPQFLAEFALETLDPEHSKEALGGDQEMYQAAIEAIAEAIQSNRGYNFAAIGDEATARRLEMLQELRSADTRLRTIVSRREQALQAAQANPQGPKA